MKKEMKAKNFTLGASSESEGDVKRHIPESRATRGEGVRKKTKFRRGRKGELGPGISNGDCKKNCDWRGLAGGHQDEIGGKTGTLNTGSYRRNSKMRHRE